MFSTAVADPREEHRDPGLSSVFFLKNKDSTHNGQTCMECKLDDLPHGHVWPLPIGQYCQSSVIFGSEKDHIDKYR